jgi:hypothetical protein
MKDWNEVTQPTPQQVEEIKWAQRAITQEVDLLAEEGVKVTSILTGMGMVVAELITYNAEAAAVVPWFEKQAMMILALQQEGARFD